MGIIISNMETEKPININISRTNDKEDKYNEFKEYLVINNLDLQVQVLKLRDEINDLKNQLNEKENDEDKYDSRTRYMRNLLTNLNELKKGYKEISENRKYLVNEVARTGIVIRTRDHTRRLTIPVRANITFLLIALSVTYSTK